MKTIFHVSVLLFLFLLSPLSQALSFEGPLQVRNLYPLFLHADQPYMEKASVENSMSYSLSHSSTYTVQESGEWTIYLDMEITELNFRYKRIIRDTFEFGLEIPVLVFGDGFMDGFLEDYHDTFGFPDYGRSERPHNDFLYEVRKNGELIIQGKSGTRLGDIRLSAKRPLYASEGFHASIAANVEIPVSNAKKGYSNGSLDAGVSLLVDRSITDSIMTHWNFGAVFPGDVRGHEKLNINNFIYGGAAVEAALGKELSVIVQVLGQSEIYPETDLLAVDRDSYIITFGGRYKKGTGILELSLAEDISESGAPDFIVNLTYKKDI